MPSRRNCEVQNNCYIIIAQKNIFLFSQERSEHAAVVVDGKEDIIILGGGPSSRTGEIVKGE